MPVAGYLQLPMPSGLGACLRGRGMAAEVWQGRQLRPRFFECVTWVTVICVLSALAYRVRIKTQIGPCQNEPGRRAHADLHA